MLFSLVLAATLGTPPDVGYAMPTEITEAPRYYFTLFGGQSVPFRPRTAHTWATFTRVTPTAGGPVVEPITISWLPVTGVVEPARLRSVPGRNWSLQDTFAIMAGNNAQVSMWGPFEIDEGRYHAAVAQAQRLDSGAVRFRSLDSLNFRRTVAHCVHAVTHADPVLDRRIQPVVRVGEPGTSRLAAMYVSSGAFVGGPVTHDWLIPATGADQYRVIRRAPGERIPRR